MALPVFARHPLIVKKSFLRMISTREAELYPKVGPNSHDQDALTSLWNSEVGGV